MYSNNNHSKLDRAMTVVLCYIAAGVFFGILAAMSPLHSFGLGLTGGFGMAAGAHWLIASGD